MEKRYQHTQIGYVIIFALLISMLLITYLMSCYSFNMIPRIVLIILGICLVLFPTLTVSIQGDVLELRFGPGIIRKKFYIHDIESFHTVKNSWLYGWGIHLTPHGWLFNVSGLDAIEICLKNRKRYRIGTDEPENLEKAIRKSCSPVNERNDQ
jgi:hypothetical protein